MVLFETPADQWMGRNPSEVLDKEVEAAVLEPLNPYVLRAQLPCAARELPLNSVFSYNGVVFNDTDLWGGIIFEDVLEHLLREAKIVRAGRAVPEGPALAALGPGGDRGKAKVAASSSGRGADDGGWDLFAASPGLENPARAVSLRMIDPVTFSIVDDSSGRVIDSIGYSRAFFEVYPGAVILVQGRQFMVVKLDLESHVAHTRPVKVEWATASRNHTDVNVVKRWEATPDGCVGAGSAAVIANVWGYRKYWLSTGKTIELHEFSLPPLEFATQAFWIDVPQQVQALLVSEGSDVTAAIHTVNHALLAVLPTFVSCDGNDVGTEHTYPFQQRPRPPRVIVYDRMPGGIGVCEALFYHAEAVLERVRAIIADCPCDTGCPSCVHDARCSHYNEVLDKRGALSLIDGVAAYRAAVKTERSGRRRAVGPEASFGAGTGPAPAEQMAGVARGGGGCDGSSSEDGDGAAAPEETHFHRAARATKALGEVDAAAAARLRRKARALARAMDNARARSVAVQRPWLNLHCTISTECPAPQADSVGAGHGSAEP